MKTGSEASEQEALRDQKLLFEYFARCLVGELRTDSNLDQWTNPKLKPLLSLYVDLLNSQGGKLGDMIQTALKRSQGKLEAGNINQMALHHPDVFADTEQHAIDDFRTRKEGSFPNEDATATLGEATDQILSEIGDRTLDAYATLGESDRNLQRTLDTTTRSLLPLFVRANSRTRDLGESLVEYRDYWRTMNQPERAAFAQKMRASQSN